MSEERKTIQVGVGEKCTPPADAEITELAKPEEDEVGGRYLREAWVRCPNCYITLRIIEETQYRKHFKCCNCFYTFLY